MADLRKHVERAAEQVERLPRHMGGRAVAGGRTDPQRSRQTPMWAMLRAGNRVRGGFHQWLRGAPTHVLAELLTELREDGFEVVPADDQLTVEEAEALLYSVDVPVGSKDSRLLAKLRRLAGRED